MQILYVYFLLFFESHFTVTSPTFCANARSNYDIAYHKCIQFFLGNPYIFIIVARRNEL